MVKNILTFDIEEWYEMSYPGIDLSTIDISKNDLVKAMQELLAMCERTNAIPYFYKKELRKI